MERLTKRSIVPNEYRVINPTVENCNEVVNRLGAYEDAEEQGLLLRLPVAIGQTVYTNHSMQGWYCRKNKRPYEAEVVYIGLNNCQEAGGGYINIAFKEKKGCMMSFTFNEIGITWFLTKEEAEQKLAEMKGERVCVTRLKM